MNLTELLLGQIPEAVYFALFLIFTKNLKEKRISFVILMTLEYLLILNIQEFSTYCHIIFVIMTYLTLKVLYKEKAQITDVFTFGIASLILMIISAIFYYIFTPNVLLAVVCSKIILFTLLFLFRNKLYNIQKVYKLFWNRSDKPKKKMKSVTFRSLNIIVFNFMFYIINLGMIYAVLFRK